MMYIVVCGSMDFSPEMLEVGRQLEGFGHQVTLPEFIEEYASLPSRDHSHREAALNKREHDLIRGYFSKIQQGDAVLICNYTKKGVQHYVGGNSFLEMGFAHVLRKPLYLYHPIPDMHYRDEIEAMQPIVIDGNLERIVLSPGEP